MIKNHEFSKLYPRGFFENETIDGYTVVAIDGTISFSVSIPPFLGFIEIFSRSQSLVDHAPLS